MSFCVILLNQINEKIFDLIAQFQGRSDFLLSRKQSTSNKK